MVPSADTASATTGAVCPCSTLSGALLPALQSAMRPSAPPVTARPSASSATAFTASSWKRSTCSALLRVSDQRIAEESKLPESASLPSCEPRARAPAAMAAQLGVRGGGEEDEEEREGKATSHRPKRRA